MLVTLRDNGWKWNIVSSNEGITIADMEIHMDLPWDWSQASHNPNLRLQDVEKYANKPWKWNRMNPSVFNPDEYIDQ